MFLYIEHHMSKQAKTAAVYNIISSHMANKENKKIELVDLPKKVLQIIAAKYKKILKYELRDWVKDLLPLRKLHNDILSQNPNAIDFLKDNRRRIDLHTLSANTNQDAIEILKEHIDSEELDWAALSSNPAAMELLKAKPNKIVWAYLCSNTNHEAIDMLRAKVENEENLSIKTYRQKHEFSQRYINWNKLSSNPKAIDIIKFALNEENKLKDEAQNVKQFLKVSWSSLCSNTNAIDLLTANKDKIDWEILSSNPNAIKLLIKKIEEDKDIDMLEYYRKLPPKYKIDWNALSKNPAIFIPLKEIGRAKSAIVSRILTSYISPKSKTNTTTSLLDLPKDLQREIIKKYKDLVIVKNRLRYGIPIDKLNWEYLSENPNVIDLLRDRIDFEKSLTQDEYKKLPSKINWSSLCRNSDIGAIYLLQENYDKIDWSVLSSNPNAIHLLEDRVKYQLKIQEEGRMDTLKMKERISWKGISANTAIFVPV
jgi:hypothetical protein